MHLGQLPSGKWRAAASHGGRLRWTAAKATKAEARLAGAALLLELGVLPKSVDVTVLDLIDGQLAEQAYSPTTKADLQHVADRLPADFTGLRVTEVTPPTVHALYRQLHAQGWSLHRVRRVHELLSVSFKRAVRIGWIPANPCRDVPPPKPPAADIAPPDVKDVRRLIEAAPDKLRLFLRLAASTGARRGELVALRWDVVDLERRRLRVKRSLVYTPDSGTTERGTKTGEKGWRWVALAPGVAKALAEHQGEQAELFTQHFKEPHPCPTASQTSTESPTSSTPSTTPTSPRPSTSQGSGSSAAPSTSPDTTLNGPTWVFSNDLGITPWRPDYVTLTFGKLRKKLGLTHVRLHDLRHFMATTMLADGEPVHVVAGRLGHRTAATTQRVYAHFLPEQDRGAADRLDL